EGCIMTVVKHDDFQALRRARRRRFRELRKAFVAQFPDDDPLELAGAMETMIEDHHRLPRDLEELNSWHRKENADLLEDATRILKEKHNQEVLWDSNGKPHVVSVTPLSKDNT